MSSPEEVVRLDRRHKPRASATRAWALAMVSLMIAFVLWAHLASGVQVFRSQVSPEPGWEKFRADYRIDSFGQDGQFVRAVQNGFNLVHYTPKYASRFTPTPTGGRVVACVSCHTPDDLAYGFVNSDRVHPKLGKRISFEDQVRRCYAGSMAGFVPTIYDPAVRDIRLLARAVAHHLQLGEGAIRSAR